MYSIRSSISLLSLPPPSMLFFFMVAALAASLVEGYNFTGPYCIRVKGKTNSSIDGKLS